jgi:hypothetical protein
MWTYSQNSGKLSDPSGRFMCVGYAGGNCGNNPEGVDNPDMQDVKSIGPLPRGYYTFGVPVEGSHLGPFAIPLIPDSENEMHDRGGFFLHGDKIGAYQSASEGCIIMPRDIRNKCSASADHRLQVTK